MTKQEQLQEALRKWDFYQIAKLTMEENHNEN